MNTIINQQNILHSNVSSCEQFNNTHLRNKNFKLLYYLKIYKNGCIKAVSTNPYLVETHTVTHTKDENDFIAKKDTYLSLSSKQWKAQLITQEMMNPISHNFFKQLNTNNLLHCSFVTEKSTEIVTFEHFLDTTDAAQDYLNEFDGISKIVTSTQETLSSIFDRNAHDFIHPQPAVKKYYQKLFKKLSKEKKLSQLPQKQYACLAGLARGMTAKEIANALRISNRTVEHHINTIKCKFNCYRRSDLIALAEKLGIIHFNQ